MGDSFNSNDDVRILDDSYVEQPKEETMEFKEQSNLV